MPCSTGNRFGVGRQRDHEASGQLVPFNAPAAAQGTQPAGASTDKARLRRREAMMRRLASRIVVEHDRNLSSSRFCRTALPSVSGTPLALDG